MPLAGGLFAFAGFLLTAWAGNGVQSPAANLALSAANAVSAQATNVSGTWHGTITDPRGNQHEIDLVLDASGTTVEGMISGGATGRIEANAPKGQDRGQ